MTSLLIPAPFLFDNLWRDLRFSVRRLRSSRGLAITAVLTLALGVGASTAIFTILEAVLLRPLPYKHPHRLVVIWQADAAHRASGAYFNSYAEFAAWQQQSHSFEKFAALTWATGSKTALWNGRSIDVLALPVSVDFFSMLGVNAARGRTFAPSDLSNTCTLVLAHNFWEQKLGAPHGIIGQDIQLDKSSCRVVGVMPRSFSFYPIATSAWLLITPTSEFAQKPWRNMTGAFGLLKPRISRSAAESELEAIQAGIAKDAPPDLQEMQSWKPVVLDLQSNFTWLAGRNLRKGLWLLLCASGLILLMSSVNVGGLVLGRALERERDVAVRSALGSSQARILMESLFDSVLLGLGGTAAGVALAKGLLQWFRSVHPVELPPGTIIAIDSRVLLFSALCGIASSVLFGVLPARHNSRLNLNEVLKSGSRGHSQTRTAALATNSLVVVQAGLSMVILAGAICLSISLWKLASTNLGYRTDHLFTANITLPKSRYPDQRSRVRFASEFEAGLSFLPGVTSAAVASDFVPRGLNILGIAGKADPENMASDVAVQEVSPSTFATLQIPLLRGRLFSAQDQQNTMPVALVNQALAREYFGNADPIGRFIKLSRSEDSNSPWMTVVGIVGNVKTTTVFQEMGYLEKPAVYRPLTQSAPSLLTVMVATAGRPPALLSQVQQRLAAIDGALVLGEVDALQAMRDSELSQPRFRAALFGGFAISALVLALVGLYGALSQMVVRRRHEVGVRMALGADRGVIFRSVVQQACRMMLQGIAAGVVVAAVGLRFAQSFVYGIQGGGASEFAGAAVVLLLLTSGAALTPALRAALIDPISALRNE